MKILIIKTSSLGDIIHVFPVLKFLRFHYPNAQIDWVVEKPFSELVQAHPDINHVLTIQSKKWRKNLFKLETWQDIQAFRHQLQSQSYDVIFDLQGNIKSGMVCGLSKGTVKVGFGADSIPEKPNMLFTNRRYNPPKNKNIREDYLFLAESFTNNFAKIDEKVQLRINDLEREKIEGILSNDRLQDRSKIMVCPGSIWPNKRLSVAAMTEFLQRFQQKNNVSFLFIWGTPEEKIQADDLEKHLSNSVVVDKLSLPTLQNLMGAMDLVISMDSLPLHLAATAGVPTYSVFGASSAKKYKPLGDHHHAYQGECPYGQVFEKRCPLLRTCKTGACVKNLTGKEFYRDFPRNCRF